ncbi:hypothetical protein IT418_01935 [bacterium]|nr:hypothetical protein [bacterium]
MEGVRIDDINVQSPIGRRIYAQRLKKALEGIVKSTMLQVINPREVRTKTPEEIRESLRKSSRATKLRDLVS